MGETDTGRIRRVHISYGDLDRFYEAFEKMSLLPYEYTPSLEELQGEIRENIGRYAAFLLWIDEMGTITPENELEHSEIRNMLRDCLVITDDEPGGQDELSEGKEDLVDG